ncbi:MAG: UDP-glucose 4-epimerase [Bacteroidetes bacterium 47-18]|nr:MAG: UDP-glucose 4-epimerase [Bacteroidetes bacterium 47-18]
MATRLSVTSAALDVIRQLSAIHGDLMFYQAGGCCEGTQPQCFEKGGYFPRTNDAMIGTIEGYEFWIDRDLFEYWKYAHFELDITDGWGPGGFSLETPLGKTFKVNYTLFTEAELADLAPVKRME